MRFAPSFRVVREAWVAAGFGLVHGLAFANTLTDLTLDAGRLVLSILGFNLGIELMQLLVIARTIPWLILLSQTPVYTWVRRGGALVAAVAAGAWLVERITQQPNGIATLVERVVTCAPYGLAVLAVTSLLLTCQMRQQG